MRQWVRGLCAGTLVFVLCTAISAFAQIIPQMTVGTDPFFGQVDFELMSLDQVNRDARRSEERKAQDKKLVDSGVVSALDLEAPNSAVEEFNHGRLLVKDQHSDQAIKHLQKAIKIYPKFVSAHIGLGLAYVDQENTVGAKSEFETAEKLDEKFPGSFMNLGLLALSQKDFPTAETQLEKAAFVHPDAKILSTLAYAQNGTHQYQESIETARRVHALDHKGMADVHYVAAASAMALNDLGVVQRELEFFVNEDPTNALAPVARKNLDALTRRNEAVRAQPVGSDQPAPNASGAQVILSLPDSDRLKAQLSGVGDESDAELCSADCGAEPNATSERAGSNAAPNLFPGLSSHTGAAWTIRKSVDDVALFFAVSNHGHMIDDLELSNIQIRDDSKPPVRVLQFAPQSKLPLRLALLVDTSGSVHDRFSFEKHAAAKFVQKVLSGTSDLGFIAGFSTDTTVTQDFSADQNALSAGIEKLSNGGGTALFDAVTFACWKLAEYPDGERVARVLVILSDGEDNSSHGSLKQSIQAAEKMGVTIYTVSTREDRGPKTDADRILEVLAENSGGESMFPGDIVSLGKSFDRLRDLIRSRYFVAYKPADFQPNGSYRTINIRAEKDGKHLQVRARKGYHARVESDPN
jgi:Ca-activated chloride channel homolog